jgi:hypothetical protein
MLTVHLLGLPVDLQRRAQQHNEGLVRELTLIAQQLRQKGAHRALPVRLVALVEHLSSQYAGMSQEQEQQLEDAYESGAKTVDLTYTLPFSAADGARALGEMLAEADEYCREGKHLLTLATPPDLQAYRRWFLSEFTEQAAGRAPVPWAQ